MLQPIKSFQNLQTISHMFCRQIKVSVNLIRHFITQSICNSRTISMILANVVSQAAQDLKVYSDERFGCKKENREEICTIINVGRLRTCHTQDHSVTCVTN